MNLNEAQQAYATIRAEAARLAGGLTDLAQRATTYHHLYHDSQGCHIFPLIAAHGALWARGWFRFGMRLGQVVALQYGLDAERRRQQMTALAAFADAFRDVNRRVCIDTYTNYHYVRRHGSAGLADQLMPARVHDALQRLHWACERGQTLPEADKLAVFEAHFLNEQENVVGPSVLAARDAFHWPAMRWLALQPLVRFAYFRGLQVLRFRDFTDVNERIANGLQAFHWAAAAGWANVEDRLSAYGILEPEFFTAGPQFFGRMREAVLAC